MNLRKTLFTIIAAIGLMSSVMAPAAMAQYSGDPTNNNSTISYVVVTTPGEFDVYFDISSFDLTGVELLASNPVGNATGTFYIKYVDTMANRPNFNVQLSTTNFSHTTQGWNIIPNSGFTIEKTYNVIQGFCGGPTSTACPGSIEYGDIGHFTNNIYPSSQSLIDWTSNNTLDVARTVHFGWPGVGTNWSYGQVDVALEVPSTTVAGTYQSTLTLSVVAGNNP